MRWPSGPSAASSERTASLTTAADVGVGELHGHVARVELRDGEQAVDDRGQPLGLGGDVAQERRALLLAEEHVLAEQRLREAVDRRQRRAQLVRDGRDEVGLHLLDAALGGDVAEGVDPPGDRAGGIGHHRLAEREPDLLAAAPDRDEPAAAEDPLSRLERPAERLHRRPSERVRSAARPSRARPRGSRARPCPRGRPRRSRRRRSPGSPRCAAARG